MAERIEKLFLPLVIVNIIFGLQEKCDIFVKGKAFEKKVDI